MVFGIAFIAVVIDDDDYDDDGIRNRIFAVIFIDGNHKHKIV